MTQWSGPKKKFHTTGDVPIQNDVVYVRRSVDQKVHQLLEDLNRREVPVLFGCRQSGKSSVAKRIERHLALSCKVAFVDCRYIKAPDQASTVDDGNRFLRQLCRQTAEALGVKDAFDAWWLQIHAEPDFQAPLVVFVDFLRKVVLPTGTPRVTIILDEIDRVLDFGNAWHFLLDATYDVANRAEYTHLRILIVGLNRPVDLARSADTAKYQHFNHLRVGDFDPSDPTVAETLAEGLPVSVNERERRDIATAVLEQTGGQPFLTCHILDHFVQRKLQSLTESTRELASLVETWHFGADRKGGERPVHFDQPQNVLVDFRQSALGVLDAYKQILSERIPEFLPPHIRTVLLGTGLVVDSPAGLRPKSPIYLRVFDQNWIDLQRRLFAESSFVRSRAYNTRSTLPEVLVLNLGGTLGMEFNEELKTFVSPENPSALFARITNLNHIIRPLVQQPIARPTDGANITPFDWVTVAETIYKFRGHDIAGVLVVTGTDTLAYVASAVAFALGRGLRFPVVFTGSQAAINKPHGDAEANMLRAAMVATLGEKLPEVVIAFHDSVLRAVRADKIDDFRFDAFAAATEGPLAVIAEELQFKLPVRRIGDDHIGKWELAAAFEERVLKITQYPGLRSRYIESILREGNVKGLLIESLGIGNLPVVADHSLLPAIELARDLLIPVLISSRYPIQPEFADFYQPATAPLRYGAIPARSMAPPAALTKFMWAIAQADAAVQRGDIPQSKRLEFIRTTMNTNRLGELTPMKAES